MSPNLESSFWTRMGLEEKHREDCLRTIQELYPDHVVEELSDQGYCSFTIRVSSPELTEFGGERATESGSSEKTGPAEAFIVQIRPEQHALDLGIAESASHTYGSFTPKVQRLHCDLPGRLQAFEMDMISGIPLSRCRPSSIHVDSSTCVKQVNLVQSFATLIARAWPSPSKIVHTARNIRADSPVSDTPSLLFLCTGKVGASIIPKLNKLARELPDASLRARAAETRNRILDLKDYPIVLNHGDLIPSNTQVDPDTWRITGLVDWTEAEWLPFGTCLYGLEHLLGCLDSTSIVSSSSMTTNSPAWTYYTDALQLRDIFWKKLCEAAPEISERMDEVLLARDVGVLLWYGYAWDEGKIDRVVNEEMDATEMECLRAFLGM